MTTTGDFLQLLRSQKGDRYVFGAEASSSDTDPDAFDCSELIEWAGSRLGVHPTIPDGSWIQARHVHALGTQLDVDRAVWTPGALLFRFSSDPYEGGRPRSSHVAVSIGDGRTIEARGSKWGVGEFTASLTVREWTHAGRVPGIEYTRAEPLSAFDVAALALSAGLDEEAAVIAVAVSHFESQYRPDAAGDVGLTSGKWGASLGLWQIRSLWAHAGTGHERDMQRLRDPVFNAWAMTVISNRGTYWQPWTAYTSGAYRQALTLAREAVEQATARETLPDLAPWAEEAWHDWRSAGVLSESSAPLRTVTDQRLAVFLSRFAEWLATPEGDGS